MNVAASSMQEIYDRQLLVRPDDSRQDDAVLHVAIKSGAVEGNIARCYVGREPRMIGTVDLTPAAARQRHR